MNLRSKRCMPCEGGVPKLGPEEQRRLGAEVPAWRVEDDRLVRTFVFDDFAEAMAFVNRVAAIAEEEGHHPDFCVHYRKVDMSLWTHAIGGLSENDYILAAKVDDAAG
ncbi:MAG TPA: 4a-hydroxytetrahydrobiopterin dehydratase [Vulgatibacter sp.]|nr:4a-hydroxytetrahydrobiopterin dehydratase [Vulgatibacter sp.]